MLFIGQSLHIFLVTAVNTSTRVAMAVYSCKTGAVRARMRLSIAVEHTGDLLLTVTEFFRILRFKAKKSKKLLVKIYIS